MPAAFLAPRSVVNTPLVATAATSAPAVSGGGIAGIVIGVAAFVAIVALIAYYVKCVRGHGGDAGHTPARAHRHCLRSPRVHCAPPRLCSRRPRDRSAVMSPHEPSKGVGSGGSSGV